MIGSRSWPLAAIFAASCTVSTAPECAGDADCDDREFCNGLELCRAGVCMPGAAPCPADAVSCSDERCDEAARACTSVLQADRCDDGDACNGVERCDRDLGCVGTSPPACDDGEECTEDACDPSRGCTHAARDADGDGVGDIACGGLDCLDDAERGALARPGLTEVCDDGVDNDCDGFADAASSVCPASADRCSQRVSVSAPGTYYIGLRGLARDHDAGCFAGYADAVLGLSIARSSDVTMRARPLLLGIGGPGSGLALRRAADCASGPDVIARRCAVDVSEGASELSAHGLAPGEYALIVNGQPDAVIALEVEIADAGPPPAGSCAAPIDAIAGVYPIDTTTLGDDHRLLCDAASTLPDATFRVVLDAPRDLRATLSPGGTVALLRACAPDAPTIGCRTGERTTLARSSLPAGEYFLAIEPTPYDSFGLPVRAATLELEITAPASDDGCAAPPRLALGVPQTFAVDGAAADVGTGCQVEPHGDMAFELVIDAPSDVTLAVRALPEPAAVHASILSACGALDTLERCTYGYGDLETTARDLAPGTYVAVAGFDETVTAIEVLATARAAVPLAAGDRCEDAPPLALGGSETVAMASATDDGVGVRCGVSGAELYRRVSVGATARVRVHASADRGRVGVAVRHGCVRGVIDDACGTPSASFEHVLDPGEYWLAIEAQDREARVTISAEVLP